MSEQEIRAKAMEIVMNWLALANRIEPWDNIVRMADKQVSYIKGEHETKMSDPDDKLSE